MARKITKIAIEPSRYFESFGGALSEFTQERYDFEDEGNTIIVTRKSDKACHGIPRHWCLFSFEPKVEKNKS